MSSAFSRRPALAAGSRPAQGLDRAGSTRDADAARRAEPASVGRAARQISAGDAWRDVAGAQGVDKTLHSRFAAVRGGPRIATIGVRTPRREGPPVEWPQDESAPTKYGSRPGRRIQPSRGSRETAKPRWRIERDYQELKQELVLDHYEVEVGEVFTTTWRSASQLRFPGLRTEFDPPSDDKTLVIKTSRLSNGLDPRGGVRHG